MTSLPEIDALIAKYGGTPSDPRLHPEFVDGLKAWERYQKEQAKDPIEKLREHLMYPDPSRTLIVFTATQTWEVDGTGTMSQLLKKLGVEASEITAVESMAKTCDLHGD